MKRENLCLSNLTAHYVPKKNVETGGDFEAFAIDLYEARPLITRLRTEFVYQLVSAWLFSIHF